MSEEINDSMSFEEMLNASEEKRVHAGSIVKGIVTSISANEIQVDIGAKQTGFVKLSELTDDSSAKVEDLVKVGDELDLIVEKVMDQDGVIQLSRKKLASRKGMEEIAKAAESGEVVEGDVTEFNKGGVVVNVKGVKVFVPRSPGHDAPRRGLYRPGRPARAAGRDRVLRPQDRRQHQQGHR